MPRRRRRQLVWLVAGAVVALGWFAIDPTPDGAARAEARPAVVRGAVDPAGAPVGAPEGWRATRLDAGRYLLRFPDDVGLTIDSWDVAADVTAKPVAAGTWTIAFDAGPTPVDAAFSFTAQREG